MFSSYALNKGKEGSYSYFVYLKQNVSRLNAKYNKQVKLVFITAIDFHTKLENFSSEATFRKDK